MLDLLEHLQKEWAVIEGAPISFAIVIAVCFAIVSLAYRHRFALLKEELSDYRYALDAVAPAQLACRLRIAGPTANGQVAHEFMVSGSAKPLGSAVQVLLLAGDGRWHPQEKARFSGTGWRSRCWAGAVDTPPGTMFKVVAVDGTLPFTEPLVELPSGLAQSKVVTVFRL